MSDLSSRSDYFNSFDALKGYRNLVFLAGRPIQSAEFNELQDMILHNLSLVGKYLVSDGSIIKGGEVISLTESECTFDVGYVMVEGIPTLVNSNSVKLSKDDINIVGIKVKRELITSSDDPDIREQCEKSPYFNEETALRTKVKGEWASSRTIIPGDAFFPVMTIYKGEIITTQATSARDNAIQQAISKFDRTIHGSYIVSGLNLTYLGTDGQGYTSIHMSSGLARVAGNEVRFDLETTITIDPITDFRSVSGEPITFSSNNNTYEVRNKPIRSIIAMRGVKQESVNLTRGVSAGGVDLIPFTPVVRIISINQGGTYYNEGADFLQEGDYINWRLPGKEPPPGTTYTCVVQYMSTFIPEISSDRKSIIILDRDKSRLVDKTVLSVDYQFYLNRIDRILLDSEGNISVQKGSSSTNTDLREPQIPSGELLSLGLITVAKGVDAIVNQNKTVYLVPYAQMKEWERRLTNAEYNIAQLSLKDQANMMDPVTNKRGVVVDSLLNDNQRDMGVHQNCIIDNSTLQIPTNFTRHFRFNSSGATLLPIKGEEVIMSQPYKTKSQRINPYAGSGAPRQASISLSPGVIYGNTWWWWWHGNYIPRDATTDALFSLFNGGEVIDVYYRGSIIGQTTANNNGEAVYRLTITAGTTYGNYEVIGVGRTSGARCKAILTLRKNKNEISGDFDWNGKEIPFGADPIAQTFLAPRTCDLSSIDIFFTELPTNTVTIKVVSTLAGMPDYTNILVSSTKYVNNLGWNSFRFKSPLRIVAGTEYAFIVVTGNIEGMLASCKVGEYDPESAIWIANQTNDGVLLKSSNERTWTPVQDEDLAFVLKCNVYNTSATRDMTSIFNFLSGSTDFRINSDIDSPSGTTVGYFLQIGPNRYDITNDAVVSLPPLDTNNGPVRFFSIMESTDKYTTPKIMPGIDILAGVPETPANYVMRSFNIADGVNRASVIQVIIDAYIPSNTRVKVMLLNGGNSWVELNHSNIESIGNGWSTITYKSNPIQQDSSKLAIEMATDTYLSKPLIKNIRILMS